MPELGKYYVQVIPSTKGIAGALKTEIGGPAEGAGESAGVKLGAGIKKAIIAAGIGTALVQGISASLREGAALEQSIGGIETLYKSSAALVKQYADEAYRTAGVSANQYMEQATSFAAALVSSLGGDTKAAAETADMAIRDMSDNANKMGTDISAIQTAYQSFSRQQYMLLDNLKLGYGGTKAEMERLLADAEKITGIHYDIGNLNDVYSAIHVIQEELGITGTTAEEAERTISGSFNAMRAAAENFLGNLALGENVEESMAALAETAGTFLFDNMLPALGNVIEALPGLIGGLLPTLASDVLPGLLSFAGELIGSLIGSLPTLVEQLVMAIPTILAGVGNAIVGFFLGVRDEVANNFSRDLPEIISTTGESVDALAAATRGSTASWAQYTGIVADANASTEDMNAAIEAMEQSMVSAGGSIELDSIYLGRLGYSADLAEASVTELEEVQQSLTEELNRLQASEEGATSELNAHRIEIIETALETLDYQMAVTELNETFPLLSEALERAGYSVSDLTGYLDANEIELSEWGEAVSANIDYIINDFEVLETSNGKTLHSIASNLTKNIEAYSEWRRNIAILWEAAEKRGDAGSIAVVEALEGMGIEGSAVVAEAVSNMDYTFGTLAPLMEEAADLAMEDTTSAIAAGKTPVTSELTNVVESGKAAAKAVDFYAVGYGIDQGIAAGISGGGSLVSREAQRAALQALAAAKGALQIGSPSRVFRDEVGLMITAGIGLGIEDGTEALMGTMAALGGEMVAGIGDWADDIDAAIARIEEREANLMDTRKINEYWEKRGTLMESWLAAEAEARESGIWTEWHRIRKQIADLDQSFEDDQRKKRNAAEIAALREQKALWAEYEKYYQDFTKNAQNFAASAVESVTSYITGYEDAVGKALEDIGKEHQQTFSDIAKSQEDYAARLSGVDLFRVIDADRGKVALADFEQETRRLTAYAEVLAQLSERGLDADWIEQIRQMDIHDAYDYGSALLAMSDDALQAYQQSRREMLSLSDDIASAWAGPQIEALNDETQTAVETAMGTIEAEYMSGMEELFAGLLEDASEFGGDMVEAVARALQETGEELFGAGTFDELFAGLFGDGTTQGGGMGQISPGMLAQLNQSGLTPADYSGQMANMVGSALSAMVSSQGQGGEAAIYLDGQRVGFAVLPSIRAAAAANPEVQMI